MTIMLLTFGAFLMLISLMAIGTIVVHKPIKSFCIGLHDQSLENGCMICSEDNKHVSLKVEY